MSAIFIPAFNPDPGVSTNAPGTAVNNAGQTSFGDLTSSILRASAAVSFTNAGRITFLVPGIFLVRAWIQLTALTATPYTAESVLITATPSHCSIIDPGVVFAQSQQVLSDLSGVGTGTFAGEATFHVQVTAANVAAVATVLMRCGITADSGISGTLTGCSVVASRLSTN